MGPRQISSIAVDQFTIRYRHVYVYILHPALWNLVAMLLALLKIDDSISTVSAFLSLSLSLSLSISLQSVFIITYKLEH